MAASLLLNLGLGVTTKEYFDKYNDCKNAVIVSNKVAETKKVLIEAQDKGIVNESSNRIRSRITSATDSLRRQGGKPDLPGTSTPSAGATGTSPETIVLDRSKYLNDQLVCVTNTILAEEWQDFYSNVRKNRVANTESRILFSPARGDVSRSVQGLWRNMDMVSRGDERVWASGLPSISGQAPVTRGLSEGGDLAPTDEVSPGYRIVVLSGTDGA